MADCRHFEKSKNAVFIDIINSLLKNGNKTANILFKKLQFISTLLTATDRKPQKSLKGNVNHTNIDIQAMLVWLKLHFYDFCGFRSVAVNRVFINCSF